MSIIFLAGIVFAPLNAQADQTDTRLNGLFETLQTLDNTDQAQAVANNIWNIWIETADPTLNENMQIGIFAMRVHNFTKALELFDVIVDSAPDYAEGWNKRATVYFMIGNYQNSMSDVQKVLHLEPRHFGALSGMGLIFMETGNDHRALEAFEEALKVNPHMGNVQENIKFLKEKIANSAI